MTRNLPTHTKREIAQKMSIFTQIGHRSYFLKLMQIGLMSSYLDLISLIKRSELGLTSFFKKLLLKVSLKA